MGLETIIPMLPKDLGAIALLSFTVLLVLFGGLIPRWSHKERINDKDRQIAALYAALDRRDDQISRLLISQTSVVELLNSIKKAVEK